MKRVLVIVVTFNAMRWVDRCLGSAAGADLFVFDNASTDGTPDYIAEHFPQAYLVRSTDNLGFTPANNAGMQYALDHGYDYVYLLNQDAWLEEGALEKLVVASEAHHEYAVLSPLQMTDGYKALDKQFRLAYEVRGDMPLRHLCHPRHYKREGPASHAVAQWEGSRSDDAGGVCPHEPGMEPEPVKVVMAAHWLVPVSALKTVGLFADLFPFWGQDDDWCNRARHKGLKTGVLPSARAVHDRGERKDSPQTLVRRNYYTGSLARLCDVNRPLWERFLFVCLFTLVKAVKYRSMAVFSYFGKLIGQLPDVRAHRAMYR